MNIDFKAIKTAGRIVAKTLNRAVFAKLWNINKSAKVLYVCLEDLGERDMIWWNKFWK